MPSWVIWVIVAIVVIAIVAALVAAGRKRKLEHDRTKAGELREQAAAQATTVQKREAHARETEAAAAQARAEADRKQAEAERLEAEAKDRANAAAEHRQEHEEHLRRADELDPDVDTRRDDYVAPGSGGGVAGSGHTAGAHTVGEHTVGHTTEGEQAGAGRHLRHDEEAVGTNGVPTTDEAPTTVTHPDGSTEQVNAGGQAATPSPDGGSHRA